jgi:hypothetical protein
MGCYVTNNYFITRLALAFLSSIFLASSYELELKRAEINGNEKYA